MRETVTIKNCSGCSGEHEGLELRVLPEPIAVPGTEGTFDQATTCPATGKEIVLRDATPEEEAALGDVR